MASKPSSEAALKQALLSALTTEHYVLQAAASSTVTEAAARNSLYMLALSSSLVAMGFMSQSTDVFMPFVAAVLPALFILGVFSVVRLVDTAVENQEYLAGIARIRRYYRSLGPEAAQYFAPETGRWPEVKKPPSHYSGLLLAFFGTSASMIALINNIVAGAGIALLVHFLLGGDRIGLSLACGVAAVVALTAGFLAYERWRFSIDPIVERETAGRDLD